MYNAVADLEDLKKQLEHSHNALDEQKRKNLEIEEKGNNELSVLRLRVNELERIIPVNAPTHLDISAAEERGRKAGSEENEAALKVLKERVDVRYLPHIVQMDTHYVITRRRVRRKQNYDEV